jgi:hypothetical protein
MGRGLAYLVALISALAIIVFIWTGYTAHRDLKMLEQVLIRKSQVLVPQAKDVIKSGVGVVDLDRVKLPFDLSTFTVEAAFVETNYVELTVRRGSSLWRGGVRIFDGTNGFGKPVTNGVYIFSK